MGTGALRTIQSRVVWMFLPVERSITLSAPQRMAHTSFSTSSSMLEVTAELPMLGVVDVRRNDGAPARHLGAHECGRDGLRDVSAHGVAPQALLAVCVGQVLR